VSPEAAEGSSGVVSSSGAGGGEVGANGSGLGSVGAGDASADGGAGALAGAEVVVEGCAGAWRGGWGDGVWGGWAGCSIGLGWLARPGTGDGSDWRGRAECFFLGRDMVDSRLRACAMAVAHALPAKHGKGGRRESWVCCVCCVGEKSVWDRKKRGRDHARHQWFYTSATKRRCLPALQNLAETSRALAGAIVLTCRERAFLLQNPSLWKWDPARPREALWSAA